jgi:hypothetical protein
MNPPLTFQTTFYLWHSFVSILCVESSEIGGLSPDLEFLLFLGEDSLLQPCLGGYLVAALSCWEIPCCPVAVVHAALCCIGYRSLLLEVPYLAECITALLRRCRFSAEGTAALLRGCRVLLKVPWPANWAAVHFKQKPLYFLPYFHLSFRVWVLTVGVSVYTWVLTVVAWKIHQSVARDLR